MLELTGKLERYEYTCVINMTTFYVYISH